MPGLLIWDLDGTLIDSRADIAAAGNIARAAVGLDPLPVGTVVGFVGDGVEKLLERLIGDGDRAKAHEAFSHHYRAHCCDATRPYPGIAEALEELSAAGWVHGVATNKPTAFSRRILEGVGLMHHFRSGVVGGDRHRKPDPRQLQELLAISELAPAQAWMIGDHHTDIRAARAAGLRICWCGWGFGRDDGLPVDAVAESPERLPLLLGRA